VDLDDLLLFEVAVYVSACVSTNSWAVVATAR
jgi:hypothetical protein